MKNPLTGTPMELVRQRQSIMFRGEEVFYEHIGFEAIEGYSFTTTEQDTCNMESALKSYYEIKDNESNFKDYIIGILLIIVFSLIIL
jgi:hypothetical protein